MSLIAQYVQGDVQGDLPCAIRKNDSLGTLLGYVGVPPCHPWYGADHPDVKVHGGITFSEHEQTGHSTTFAVLRGRQERYSKVMGAGAPSLWDRQLERETEHAGEWSGYPCHTGRDIWWLGFDCAHLGDITPGPENPAPEVAHLYPLSTEGTYKDEAYVRQEIERLVSQAAAAMNELT